MSEPGLAVFKDVFRRADKNDDEAVSLDEFRTFFRDNVLSNQELDSLFDAIDTDKSKNVDCNELSTFFLNHWGDFKGVFASIEETNNALNVTMNKIAASYKSSDLQSQFCTRFLLREIKSQFETFQTPINSALQHLETISLSSKAPETTAAPEPVIRRKKLHQLNSTQSRSVADSSDIKSQVDRLSQLLTRLEGKVSVNALNEDDVDSEDDDSIVLVKREFQVAPDSADNFRRSLKEYQQASTEDTGYLHFYIRHVTNSHKYILYEIWDNDNNVAGHFTRRHFRQFQRENVENLAAPENSVTIKLPSSWWSQDD